MYLARREGAGGFEKLVIIKRIHQQLTDDPTLKKIFVDETFGSGSVDHPNVRQVYEFGRHGQHFYIALEYLEGIPLVKFILARRHNPELADPRLLATIFSQTCEGLDAAHKKKNAYGTQIIHANLNPRAIFITSNGNAKVLDLDIADMRGTLAARYGFVKRTFSYISPEESHGRPPSIQSDIFSLGVVAWEAVFGRRLFQRPHKNEVLEAIRNYRSPPPMDSNSHVSKELSQAIIKAIELNPSNRYRTASEFGEALLHAAYVEGPPITSLSISRSIQEVFSSELEEQFQFVKKARDKQNAQFSEEFTDYTSVDSNPVFAKDIEAANINPTDSSTQNPFESMLREVENELPELFEWHGVPGMGTPEHIHQLTELSHVEIDLPAIFDEIIDPNVKKT